MISLVEKYLKHVAENSVSFVSDYIGKDRLNPDGVPYRTYLIHHKNPFVLLKKAVTFFSSLENHVYEHEEGNYTVKMGTLHWRTFPQIEKEGNLWKMRTRLVVAVK